MTTKPHITLQSLADEQAVVQRLAAGGLVGPAALDKARLLGKAAEALLSAGIDANAAVAALFVPGRIEVLGKHTDYAGGRSIVVATEQGFCMVAAAGQDAALHVMALDVDDRADLSLLPDLTPTVGHWSNYPATVARRVARNFPGPLRGAVIAFCGDLPPAAGMSSSSALMVGIFLILSAINDLPAREEYRREIDDLESLGGYLGTVENGQSFGGLVGDKGVGTFGGSEDHTAILCCRPGQMSQYSYCPVRLERRITMPAGYVFAVASSGVVAEKTGQAMAKYNRASLLASAVADAWRRETGRDDPHVAAAMASGEFTDTARRISKILRSQTAGPFTPDQLIARFEHFLAESENIIPKAGDALCGDVPDLAGLGELVDRSQRLAETLLGNQIPETIALAAAARQCGAVAASAFGAGFGGGVWAMVAEEGASDFLHRWRQRYADDFAARCENAAFFCTHAGPAAFELT